MPPFSLSPIGSMPITKARKSCSSASSKARSSSWQISSALSKIDAEIEFVRLSSYGKARTSSGTVTIIKDIHADIRGKHVLIVEEIIDSGRTLKFLYERLKASGPASVEIVTLLDKASKRIVDVPVKYVGRPIDDQFLIGYGLDLEERSRNLPDVYYLKYPN